MEDALMQVFLTIVYMIIIISIIVGVSFVLDWAIYHCTK